MPPLLSILLAEPNPMLREKIAGILARNESVWCVIQVEGADGLARGASEFRPDIVLADLSAVKDPDTLRTLRRRSKRTRMIALVDSQTQPYLEAARRLGLDGAIEKGRVAEAIRDEIRSHGLKTAGDEKDIA